ncbi:MAG: VWA domain-containing protein [Myxococcales bacterium]|nr:VWA domain-containing protein [Myxococcales bacterium]
MAKAKKSVAKKPVAKRPAAKKAVAKKAVAKKAVAKKAAAKKAVARRPHIPEVQAPEAPIATPTTATNYIALVLDRSGSMSRIRAKVVASCNEQLASVRANAASTGQPSYASVFTFESHVDPPLFFGRAAEKLVDLESKDVRLGGATALLDGVGTAITHLKSLPGAEGPSAEHVSYLVVTITDGFENASNTYKKNFATMLADCQRTGRWSFVFMCPKAGVKTLVRFGVPAGNIMPWQPNNKGAEQLGKQVAEGLQQYYEQRASGQKATTKFFVTDVASVDRKALTEKLVDLSDQFARFAVKSSDVIRPFVESALKKNKDLSKRFGSAYQKGHAYYELTKAETVQAAKSLLIVDRSTNKIYGGDQARALLGLPIGESCKVKPGDHGDYAIFVESTSVNRRLESNTTLLYRA